MNCQKAMWVGSACLFLVVSVAYARPIPVGQFTRVPFGISGEHPWMTKDGGRLRQSRSKYQAPTHAPQKKWSIDLGGGRIFPPTVDKNGSIFVATHRGMMGIDPVKDSAAPQWRKRFDLLSGTASLSPAGNLVVGLRSSGGILMLNADGNPVRRVSASSSLVNTPLVLDDGSFVVGLTDKSVARFDSLGLRIFSTFLDQSARSEVAMHSSGLVVATRSKVVFMRFDGRIKQSIPIDNITLGPAIADDGTVWVATYSDLLSLTESGIVTTTALPFSVSHSSKLAIGSDNAVRVGGASGGIACVGPGGTIKWVYKAAVFSGGIVIDKRNTLIGVSRMRRLTAIDASGKMLWESELKGYTETTPVLQKDGTILVTMERPTVIQAWR